MSKWENVGKRRKKWIWQKEEEKGRMKKDKDYELSGKEGKKK